MLFAFNKLIHPFECMCAGPAKVVQARGDNNKNNEKLEVKVNDEFNETDDDVTFRVVKVQPKRKPPIAICRAVKRTFESSDSEDTDEVYDLEYVRKCVWKRKDFMAKGFHKLDAKGVYKMHGKELQLALFFGKQKCTGTKAELRTRLLSFLNILEIPSSCSSGSATEEEEDESAQEEDEEATPNEMVLVRLLFYYLLFI